jgi:hypothetical protein
VGTLVPFFWWTANKSPYLRARACNEPNMQKTKELRLSAEGCSPLVDQADRPSSNDSALKACTPYPLAYQGRHPTTDGPCLPRRRTVRAGWATPSLRRRPPRACSRQPAPTASGFDQWSVAHSSVRSLCELTACELTACKLTACAVTCRPWMQTTTARPAPVGRAGRDAVLFSAQVWRPNPSGTEVSTGGVQPVRRRPSVRCRQPSAGSPLRRGGGP